MTISKGTTEASLNNKPELLAPAGDYECFIAAMNAGADAVYLGLSQYGARAFAKNFSDDELVKALDIAHILGRKIYATVNTLLKDDELDSLFNLLERPYSHGLHGVIVQDIGVMSYIHRFFPDLPIHVSTQAAITSAEGCALFKDLGVTRIVPARELSLSEIRQLKDKSGLEIECFIHGSLCYSYSGKCLLSSFIGGRSGNRGRCAGPCRLMYDDSYPLSLKDLCTIDMIPELINAGVDSFKIEGRMKSCEYVYGVTSLYRKYIGLFCENDKTDVERKDMDRLISYYTRSGNCKGYYCSHNGQDMITPDSPSYESNTGEEDIKEITKVPSIPVSMKCTIRKGKCIELNVSCDRGEVSFTSDFMAENATGEGLKVNDVNEQLIKSGGTNFSVKDIVTDLDDGLFIPKGRLNAIRRDALELMKKSLISVHKRETGNHQPLPDKLIGNDFFEGAYPEVNVSVLTLDQLIMACRCPVDGIIIPIDIVSAPAFEVIPDDEKGLKSKKIYLSLPYIVREEGLLNSGKMIIETIVKFSEKHEISGFYISNNESLELLKNAGFENNITGDIYIYVFNGEAYEKYRNSGISKTTVPVELNSKELYKRGIKGEELLIYGKVPVMISANCLYNTKYGCKKTGVGHRLNIKDRKGANLFVSCICKECINVIYNSEVLSISDEIPLFDRIRPSSVRMAFTDEDPDMVRMILEKYFSNRNKNGSTGVRLIDRYTKGHLNRGVD